MRHPGVLSAADAAHGDMIKGLAMPDLRTQCRARGLTPAGTQEELRARLREHMDATNDYNMYGDGGPQGAPDGGLPPRGPNGLPPSRAAISQMHFQSDGSRGNSRGGPAGPYGGPTPPYGSDPYGAPQGGYGQAPPMGGGYDAPSQAPAYGRRNSMGSRGDPNGGPPPGMGGVMDMGLGFDVGGAQAGRRSREATPPSGRAAGLPPGAREGVSFGSYNAFQQEQPRGGMQPYDDGRSMQMSPSQAAAASRQKQQHGSYSFGDYSYFKEDSGPGGAPGAYSQGQRPSMPPPPGNYGMAPPDMVSAMARERAAYGGMPPQSAAPRGPPPPQLYMGGGGGGGGMADGPASPMNIEKALRGMSVNDMRTELRARGLNPGGSQETLLERLKEAMILSNDGGRRGGMPPSSGGAPYAGGQAGGGQFGSPSRPQGNNYARPGGAQNVGNFLTDRPSSRVLAPPGGKSQISFC